MTEVRAKMKSAVGWVRGRVGTARQKIGGLWAERLRTPGRTEYGGENVDLDPPDMGGLL